MRADMIVAAHSAIAVHTAAAGIKDEGSLQIGAWHLLCSMVDLYKANGWDLALALKEVEGLLADEERDRMAARPAPPPMQLIDKGPL